MTVIAGATISERLLRLAVGVLFAIGAAWLSYQFWRLLLQPPPDGAIDLRQRFDELHAWFSGEPVYGHLHTAVYPPASYVLLWPMLAWSSFTVVRWIWAVTAVLSLAWLVLEIWKEMSAETPLERALLAAVPVAMYATGAAIGNGQLTIHLMPLLLAGLILLRDRTSPGAILAASGLFLLALIKPSVTAPFFLIVLARQHWRAAATIVTGYALFTVWAAVYQSGSPTELLVDWFSPTEVAVDWGNERGGNLNQASWLMQVGLSHWSTMLSLVLLAVLGAWMYIHRSVDLWVLLGVTGVMARFWTYHAWYDDILLLLPLLALYLIAKNDERWRLIGYATAGGLMLSLLAPGGLYALPGLWKTAYVGFQLSIWLSALAILVCYAWTHRLERREALV